jgi:predicted tellurium resistance membrane protein TerC
MIAYFVSSIIGLLAIGLIYFLFKSRDEKFQFLRMCVASVGCFGGLAAVIVGVDKKEDAIIPGVVVAGLALAVLLRIMSQLIASEINKGKRDSDGPS